MYTFEIDKTQYDRAVTHLGANDILKNFGTSNCECKYVNWKNFMKFKQNLPLA